MTNFSPTFAVTESIQNEKMSWYCSKLWDEMIDFRVNLLPKKMIQNSYLLTRTSSICRIVSSILPLIFRNFYTPHPFSHSEYHENQAMLACIFVIRLFFALIIYIIMHACLHLCNKAIFCINYLYHYALFVYFYSSCLEIAFF